MKKTRFTLMSLATVMTLQAQTHTVNTFGWVSGLSSTYSGDSNTNMTFAASGAGSVTTGSGGTFSTPFSEFGTTLVLGSETANTATVATFNYSLSFSNPVTDLSLYIWGHSPFDTTTNFSIAPTSLTDATTSTTTTLTWDGTTISTSSGGGGNAIVNWAGPISTLSFTTQTAGLGDSVGLQQITWVSVPEPSTFMSLAFAFGTLVLRRRRA